MLAPAILLHLAQPPIPPEPSAIVEERVWLSEQGQRAQRIATRLADQYALAVDSWMADLAAFRDAYALVPPGIEPPEVLTLLDEAIEQTEALAELRARRRARLSKRVRSDARARFKVDPSLAAVTRELGSRLLASDDRVIEGLLEDALFLRAVRSERAPREQPAAVLDDPDALDGFLRQALA